jgi:DNA-binding CsgD family transcriptional regulator
VVVDVEVTPSRLTRRQRQVLNLIARGYQLRAAADLLGIGVETARQHRKNAKLKLGARTTAHAVALGIFSGEITLADVDLERVA